MSYDATTDFIGLLRLVGTSLRSERMPGLDYVVSALNRIGLFSLSISQTAPTVNQSSTVWLKPAIPSWSAEGTVYLWNASALAYQIATPTLWKFFFNPSAYLFQSLVNANNVINAGTSLAAVQRVAPVATAVVLPTVDAQFATLEDIVLVDYSTGLVGDHTITVTPVGFGTTIMQQASWRFISTPDSLVGVKLRACPDLNAWIIAP